MTNTYSYTDRPMKTKGTRTMRASRDFTTGDDFGTATQVLERGRSVTPQRRPRRDERSVLSRGGMGLTRTLEPTRTSPTKEGRYSTGNRGRLGSRQVVSQRGRRLTEIKKVTLFSRLSGIAIAMLITGVVLAMWLSSVSTSQTFQIQRLTATESQLSNQIETLNRDLENVRSSADVARRAAESNMGVPVAPGIVEVKENGDITERRPAEAGTESIIDVNGAPVRPGQASSDPNATEDISDSLEAVPSGRDGHAGGEGPAPDPVQQVPDIPAQSPYANVAQ